MGFIVSWKHDQTNEKWICTRFYFVIYILVCWAWEGKRQRRQGTTEIVDVRAVRKNRNELSFRAEKREGNMWRGGVKKWKIYFFKGWLQRRLESSKGTRTLWRRLLDSSAGRIPDPMTPSRRPLQDTPGGFQSHPNKKKNAECDGVGLAGTDDFFHICTAVWGSIYCQTHIACIFASIQVSGAEHPACDHARIGFLTGRIVYCGRVQTLQFDGHVRIWNQAEQG